MDFIFFCSLLAVSLLQCLRIEGMAVVPQRRYQDGIAKETIKFFEKNDAICESHRNYRQAPVKATTPLQKDASGSADELKIVIKHHTTPTDDEKREVTTSAFIERSPSSFEENDQLSKDLEKKMNTLESKGKHPKTRSYSEHLLHHKKNRYDHPSNGNLEVFLGGSSNDDSSEQSEFSEPEWRYQGFGNKPANEYQDVRPAVYRQDPERPRNSCPGENHAKRYNSPGADYENKEQDSESGEYVPKRKSGYRDSAEGGRSGEYASGKKSGYERGYEARKSKNYGNKDEQRDYEPKKDNDGKEGDGYSSEKKSGEDVLVKITVDNDQDSPNLGKVKIDVNKDKDLFPEERQLKITVKHDKDLPPTEEREIKLDIEKDYEQEDGSGKAKILVGKEGCGSGDDRTIIQVKKPSRKCCKKRKGKSTRKRRY